MNEILILIVINFFLVVLVKMKAFNACKKFVQYKSVFEITKLLAVL